ncbi:XylR family transcriptional regulator [Bythopirellula polymerisocia]|uniref:XylR family transcriptional regulator n=1 Tax=Bythopirellula polymerisocia TaxID=2528003 RepID=UPI001E3FB5F4|nr:DNA-binding transcriptional regulator [Bythopirellula polymerisocia]
MNHSKTLQNRKSVALLIETSNAYARGLLDGIIAYQREHDPWSIYVGEQGRGAQPPLWIKNWKGDGIIARIETDAIATVVRRTHLPVVDVSAARLVKNIPWVETDDREIARLAAQHLIERGFEKLAFCGEPQFNWSQWRQQHFTEMATEEGCEFFVFEGKSRFNNGYSWNAERRRLKKWVQNLPKPIGVMACYDFTGQQLLDVCRELEIAVPEQMAVIGVDNDVRLCRLCTPPLSSVIPDTHRTGYQAAQLLDQLMQESGESEECILVPPSGIAERQSSDVYALDDIDIVSALRFIRENACKGISVADVLKAVPLSRRMLEHRFQKLVRRTPHAEIIRIRMERACRLLRETDLSLAEITSRSGFANPDYFSVAFKNYMETTPRNYRKKNRLSRRN